MPTTSVANSSGAMIVLIMRMKIEAEQAQPTPSAGQSWPISAPTTIETRIQAVSERRRQACSERPAISGPAACQADRWRKPERPAERGHERAGGEERHARGGEPAARRRGGPGLRRAAAALDGAHETYSIPAGTATPRAAIGPG